MKKTIYFSIFLIIFTIILNVSCKKSSNNFIVDKGNSLDMAIVPNGTNPQYIEKQLTWIARVLPYLARTVTNFKSNYQGLLLGSASLSKQNWPSQTALLTTPMNYTNSVNNAVNSLFPSNNYDSAYFFSFLYEDCVNRTCVRINKPQNIKL
jgi:hypothetical protein